jgi:hypothetical protein
MTTRAPRPAKKRTALANATREYPALASVRKNGGLAKEARSVATTKIRRFAACSSDSPGYSPIEKMKTVKRLQTPENCIERGYQRHQRGDLRLRDNRPGFLPNTPLISVRTRLSDPDEKLMADVFNLLELKLHLVEPYRSEGTGSIPIPNDGGGEVSEGGL